VVLSARSKEESLAFYRDVLGFRLSDEITCSFHGHSVDLAFLNANPRHHSVAFGGPQRKRLHHFMVEVQHLDDVGLALDRVMAARLRIVNLVGRHPNDQMLSFYALTPSKFQIEVGWGARLVDGTEEPVVYDRISDWGHHPPMVFNPKPRS
jgi:2,3-dihydroxybiphenyl 1,2-dioxygenase